MITTPIGQTFITHQVSDYLLKNYDVRLSISGVNISFFDHVHIDDIYVEDHKRDTLAYIQRLDAGIWKLMIDSDINTLNFRDVKLYHPRFYLREYEGDTLNNLSILLNKFDAEEEVESEPGTPFKLNINEFHLRNGTFLYDEETAERQEYGMDWSRLKFDSIFMELRRFHMVDDTIETDFRHFELKEQSGFRLNEFAGQVIYSPEKTEIQNFKLITPHTDLNTYLKFTYNHPSDYGDFNEKIRMQGEFYNSKINFKDITYFAPDLKGWEDEFRLSGSVRGTVSNLRSNNLDLYFGSNGHISGNISMIGLPDIDDTFINLDLDDLRASSSDLKQISIPPFDEGKKLPVPKTFDKLGQMRFRGKFTGFINDFVADGQLNTALGFLETDVKLAKDKREVIHYSGKVKARNFEFGKLVDAEDKIGKVSLSADIKGKEFDLKKIDADMNGTIQKLDFLNYPYQDIKVGGNFKNERFSGNFSINDSNLAMDFNGDIMLGDSFDLGFTADIKRAYPVKLGFIERDSSLFVSTRIESNFKGSSVDDILGRITLDSTTIKEGENEAELGKIEFLALTTPQGKTLNLQNKHINTTLTGKFNFDKLPKAFAYMSYKIAPSAFDEEPEIPQENESFKLELALSKTAEVTEVFYPDWKGPDTLDLTAEFDVHGKRVDLEMTAGEWSYGGTVFDPMELVYLQDENNVEWDFYTDNISVSEESKVSNLSLSGRAAQDSMDIYMLWDNELESKNFTGDIIVTFKLDSLDSYHLDFKASEVVIADTMWNINSKSIVSFNHDTISIKDFKFYNQNQELTVFGDISPDSSHQVFLEAGNFDLKNFNFLLTEFNMQLNGIIEGKLMAQDLYGQPVFDSDLGINALRVNEVPLGNANLDSRYYSAEEVLKINVGFQDSVRRYVSVKGDLYPTRKEDMLDLRVLVDSLPVKIIEPLADEFIDNIKGGLNANIKLTGTTDVPKMNGKMELKNFETRVVYLNTKYTIDRAKFFVMPDLIGGDLIEIKDQKGRTAKSNISLIHDNFEDLSYDIWISTPEGFKVLNTTEKDNSIFYGDAHLDGSSTITIETRSGGRTQLTVNAGTGRNTKLFLPLGDDAEVIEKDYIKFISREDRKDEEKEKPASATTGSGFLMDFQLRVTPDASVQLIFDKTVGDIIEAEGEGDIKLSIDENFDFSIYGTYEISKGNYLFTLQDIINKRFTVRPGSRITWNGDPMRGEADITAVYTTRTNLYDLNLPLSQDTNELKRRIPVELLLHMRGNYMEPDLEFDFKLPERFRDIQDLLSNMEEGDKNKQVFSLLILNKFVAYGGAGIAPGGGAIGNNSFEMLSNQLSNWISNISNEFDIGINYRPGDEISAEEVQVALSTQLLDERIVLETNVGVQGDNPATADRGSQLIGDMQVEYKISEDGRLRSKVFNRSNLFNPAYENQAPYTQGAGLSYTENFKNGAHLRCLLKKRFMKKERREDLDCNEIARQNINSRKPKEIEYEKE